MDVIPLPQPAPDVGYISPMRSFRAIASLLAAALVFCGPLAAMFVQPPDPVPGRADYAYGPFGERISATGPAAQANPWRWATKYLDEETGLYYFGLRYYDPVTGQWLSREPLGEGESVNLYSYCHNDPVNKVDVLGEGEADFGRILEGMGQEAVLGALGTSAWRAPLTIGYPSCESDWRTWDSMLMGRLGRISFEAGAFTQEEILGGEQYTAVRDAVARYRAGLIGKIAGEKRVRAKGREIALAKVASITAGGRLAAGFASMPSDLGMGAWSLAVDPLFVALGGSHYDPWTVPVAQWTEATVGERAMASVDFILLPAMVFHLGTSNSLVRLTDEANDLGRVARLPLPRGMSNVAKGVISNPGPRGFVLVGEGSLESDGVVRRGGELNRVFDSRWQLGHPYSQPMGGSFSPRSTLPTSASQAIIDRGLNWPDVVNNAQMGVIYRANQNIPATFRTSLGGTAPEIKILEQYRRGLQRVGGYVPIGP